MDKIKNLFEDVDGLYVCWNNDKRITFFYNGEGMYLMNTSPYVYFLSFIDFDLNVKEIKHRHLMKNGIMHHIELLLKSRYEILEEDYLKVKSIIPAEIIQPSSYEDKMKSKYTFNMKIKNNYKEGFQIHHHVYDEIKFNLYLDEKNMIWVLSYDFAYLSRKIKTKNILKDDIMTHFYDIIQRNYEWECFPDFEDDY